MAKGFKHGTAGASGVGLNFDVKAYATEAELLSSTPKENTVGIVTDTPITGYVFSAAQPEAADGLVWIKIDAFSTVAFNALKNNCLMVYPMSAKQYKGGAWTKVTARSYQGDTWAEWIPEGALYYHGDECVNTSGGWQARGWKNEDSYGVVVPVIVNHDDCLEITVDSGQVVSGVVEIQTDQDFTNISGITIDFEVTLTEFFPRLLVIDRNAAYLNDAVRSINLAGDNASNGTFSRRTVTLDTSGLSGLYDVAIGFVDAWAGAKPTGVTMKVYSLIKSEEVVAT